MPVAYNNMSLRVLSAVISLLYFFAGNQPLFAAELPLSDLYDEIQNPLESLDGPVGAVPEVHIDLQSDFGGDRRYDTFELGAATTVGGLQQVRIRANTRAAALYAVDELAARLSHPGLNLPDTAVTERAGLPVRALHLVMRNMTLPRLRSLIDKARRARMNTLLLYVADDVRFEAAGIVPLKNAMSKQDFAAAVRYARASGMNVVPHVPLLTKQHRFFKHDAPELMYNNSTYDPRNEETMRRVYAHLQEIIDLVHPTAIHIGHDEVEGAFPRTARSRWTAAQRRKWLGVGQHMLPPALFLQHVRDVRAFLAERSVSTWMWGDMLISHDEFPGMVNRNMHGNHGYAELRSKIPKDIVICDWHYHDVGDDFPTARAFADAGHPVLGSTRDNPANINAFSRYVAGMEQGGLGMIATLWNLVNKREKEYTDEVIAGSGRAFWSPELTAR